MKKDFILGIGSQRAGSTFIARLLNQHPSVAIHPLKELHYFDTMFGLRNEETLTDFSKSQLNREINKLCDAENFEFITSSWKWYLRTNLTLYTKSISEIQYFDLFSDVYESSDIDIIGESTPEYMLLSKSQIHKMREIIGGNARIIIICRNPIKRIVSSFRLLLEYRRQGEQKSFEQCDELFLQLIEKNDIWIKRQMLYNDYERAIENYKLYFNNVLVLKYDDVINAPEKIIDEISNFTNLDFHTKVKKEFFKRKINSLSTKYLPGAEVARSLERLIERDTWNEKHHFFEGSLIH